MPPKPSIKPSGNPSTTKPSKKELEAINNYLAQKPDFQNLLKETSSQKLASKREETEYETKSKQAVAKALRQLGINSDRQASMPLIPGENDQAMKDKLAQGAKEAEAAKAERTGKGPSQGAEKANLGPVMVNKLPEAASKEELKKRAEELNK